MSDKNVNNINLKSEEVIDFSQYWSTVSSYKWRILIFTAAVVVGAFMFARSMDRVYSATTTLLIESDQAKVVSIDDVYEINTNNKEYFLTQFEVLKSRELAERVVKSLNLVKHPLFDPEQQPEKFDLKKLLGAQKEEPKTEASILRSVVKKFHAGITISPVRNTQLVNISYESSDPELSALAANRLAEEYIQSHIEAQLSVTVQAANWLTERLDGLQEKLRQSEQRLQDYRESAGLVDVKGVQTLDAEELEELTQSYVEASKVRSEFEAIHQQVQALGGNPSLETLLTIPSIAENELVQTLREEQVLADRKVAELSKRYGPKHPKMIAAMSDAEQALTSLMYQTRRVSRGLESRYLGALKTEQTFKREISEAKARFQNVNRKEFKLRELERDVEANRELYELFLTRAKETSEAEGLQSPHARIVDPAVVPSIPVAPNENLIVAAAGFMSLMIGVCLALVFEAMNNTFRTPDDVEERLGLRMLGFLPLESKNKSKLPFEGFKLGAKGVFPEAIRTVRTSLVLADSSESQNIILITSSIPGEGKSTTALNLARALGQVEKVLLIDADMRRPTLSRVLDLPRGAPGLSNWVAGTSKVSDIIYRMDDWPVDVMPSGIIPHNPLELLTSKRFASALDKLKEHYDRIVIDSAPVCAVSDALVLASYADVLVYLIKSNSTSTSIVAKGVGSFKGINIPKFGILNQVDVRKSGQYYMEYFNNYGYTSEDEFNAQVKYQKPKNNEVDYVQNKVFAAKDVKM